MIVKVVIKFLIFKNLISLIFADKKYIKRRKKGGRKQHRARIPRAAIHPIFR
jgi:hypothetical protein